MAHRHIMREESIMGLRGVLRAEAKAQGETCDKFLRDLGKLPPEDEGRQLVNALADGVNYGNWPWIVARM